MPITLGTYVPPLIGIIVVALLIVVLRRLLRLPPGAVLAPAEPVAAWREVQYEHDRACQAIADRWGGRRAALLAASIGAAVLIIAVWALAYVGWTARYGVSHFSNPPVLPPAFGGPFDIVAYAAIGVVVTIATFLALALFLGAAWFVGTCFLWPESCGAGKTESTIAGRRP